MRPETDMDKISKKIDNLTRFTVLLLVVILFQLLLNGILLYRLNEYADCKKNGNYSSQTIDQIENSTNL